MQKKNSKILKTQVGSRFQTDPNKNKFRFV